MICFSFSFFLFFLPCFGCLLFCFFSISNLSVSALCVARGALTRGPAPRNLVTVGNISRPQRNSLFEYICIRHRSSGNRANPPEITLTLTLFLTLTRRCRWSAAQADMRTCVWVDRCTLCVHPSTFVSVLATKRSETFICSEVGSWWLKTSNEPAPALQGNSTVHTHP